MVLDCSSYCSLLPLMILLSGVVKTHRLLLLTPTSLMTPSIPDSMNESSLSIGPRAIKDIIEHFPVARGARSDPQLIWNFGDSDVQVKSLETSLDPKGLLTAPLVDCFHS